MTRARSMQSVRELQQKRVILISGRGGFCGGDERFGSHRGSPEYPHVKTVRNFTDFTISRWENNCRAILIDIGIFVRRTMWNLDMCNSLLGPVSDLLQSKYEM